MKYTIAALLALLLSAAFCAALVSAAPDRPVPKANTPPTPKLPALAMESNWGTLTQAGKTIALSGHPLWFAEGEIRADGKVFIVWTELRTGNTGLSLYTLDKLGDLVGEWGWAEDVELQPDGTLAPRLNAAGEPMGQMQGDKIYRIKPAEPAPDF